MNVPESEEEKCLASNSLEEGGGKENFDCEEGASESELEVAYDE